MAFGVTAIAWWALNESPRGLPRLIAWAKTQDWITTLRVPANRRPDGPAEGAITYGEFPQAIAGRGFPFTLAAEHDVLGSAEGAFEGQKISVMVYRASSGGRMPSRVYFVIVTAISNSDFPLTQAEPQRGAALAKVLLGLQDIQAESDDFNRRWRVTGEDPKGASDLLQPRAIARLLEKDARGLTVTWDADMVHTVELGATFRPRNLATRIKVVADLARVVPNFVRLDEGMPGVGDVAPAVGVRPGRSFRWIGLVAIILFPVVMALCANLFPVIWTALASLVWAGYFSFWGSSPSRNLKRANRAWADEVNRTRRERAKRP
jgi:hypothetical protein